MQNRDSTSVSRETRIPRSAARYRAKCLEAMDALCFECPDDWHGAWSWPSVPLQRDVLASFIRWTNAQGFSRAVRSQLAALRNVTERSITRALEALEWRGYLERVEVVGWSALAVRLRVIESASSGPKSGETEIARLRRELAETRAELCESREARALAEVAAAAVEELEGAEVLPLPQRPDETREHVPVWIYDAVCAGKVLREDLPEHVYCATKCGCGGRYRIRTCDFIRVKDAVKGVPCELSDGAQIVREAYMAERAKPRDGKPGQRPGTFKEPPAQHWEPWIESAQAVAVLSEKTFAEAARALVGQVWSRECVGKFRAAGCPVNWFVNEPRDDIEREVVALLKRERRAQAHAARKREPCRGRSGGCTGCVECRQLEREREERKRQEDLAAKGAEQRRKLKEAAA